MSAVQPSTQHGGSINASAQLFGNQPPITVDGSGGMLLSSLGHRWLTLLSVATIGRQTPPNPAGGRVSQLLPTVKCSECSEPVPIHELGDHVCAAKTVFNNPPGIIPPPSPIHGETEHEATNRIPPPEPRPLSRQEYPPQNEEKISLPLLPPPLRPAIPWQNSQHQPPSQNSPQYQSSHDVPSLHQDPQGEPAHRDLPRFVSLTHLCPLSVGPYEPSRPWPDPPLHLSSATRLPRTAAPPAHHGASATKLAGLQPSA